MKHHRQQSPASERVGRREMARTKWTRSTLIRKYGGLCHLCGEPVEMGDPTSPKYATIDHVVPLSKGGRDHMDNLALAHQRCNRKKGDEVADEKGNG